MKISIVTPSLNQGPYIERTILSVLGQRGDFDLEFIVMDGGSTDGTLDIVKKYESDLTLVTGKDSGQSDAINKGFAMASGDIFAWLNSDDTYESGALSLVAENYKNTPFQWCFGNCRNIDSRDNEIRTFITRYKIFESKRYSYKRLLSKDFIPQPATFFTRDAFKETGPIDVHLHFAMDYDYWLRLGKKYNPLYINRFLSRFRWHDESKNGAQYRNAAREAYRTARKHAPTGYRYPIFRHYLHYISLVLLYRIIE